jgi:hypothetical protein
MYKRYSCILVGYRRMKQSWCNKKPNLLQVYKSKGDNQCMKDIVVFSWTTDGWNRAVDWVSCYMDSVTSVCIPREYNYIFYTLIISAYFCRLAVDWVSCYMDSVTSVCSPREYNYIFYTCNKKPSLQQTYKSKGR